MLEILSHFLHFEKLKIGFHVIFFRSYVDYKITERFHVDSGIKSLCAVSYYFLLEKHAYDDISFIAGNQTCQPSICGWDPQYITHSRSTTGCIHTKHRRLLRKSWNHAAQIFSIIELQGSNGHLWSEQCNLCHPWTGRGSTTASFS